MGCELEAAHGDSSVTEQEGQEGWAQGGWPTFVCVRTNGRASKLKLHGKENLCLIPTVTEEVVINVGLK